MRYGFGRYPRKVLTGTISRYCGWENNSKRAVSPAQSGSTDGLGQGCLGLLLIFMVFGFLKLFM